LNYITERKTSEGRRFFEGGGSFTAPTTASCHLSKSARRRNIVFVVTPRRLFAILSSRRPARASIANINTARAYGGSNIGNLGACAKVEWMGREHSS
jgi:hypothetical protein